MLCDLFHTVPTPTVSIDLPMGMPYYIGTSLNLTCTTELDPAVDNTVAVMSTWTGPGGAISSDERVSFSEHDSNPNVLMFSILYPEDSGTYSCSVTVTTLQPFAGDSQEKSASVEFTTQSKLSAVYMVWGTSDRPTTD